MTFRDDREQRSTIGVDEQELTQLETAFSNTLLQQRLSSPRRRSIGAGRKGSLPTVRDKVIFCPHYSRLNRHHKEFRVILYLFLNRLPRNSEHLLL